MIIEIKVTDEDNITTSIEFDADPHELDGLEDIFRKFSLFLVKIGAEFPEEINEFLYDD